MFPRLTNIDNLLLEYDTDRAGGFEPLQHVRPGRHGGARPADDEERHARGRAHGREPAIKEASTYLPLENLALSTQCGFASSGPGNPLSFDEQRAKLELISSVAGEVWK